MGRKGAAIPGRIGQAVESLETVPLLAIAYRRMGVEAPITDGLAKLISGELPKDDWVALVRTTTPQSTGWRAGARPTPIVRLRDAVRRWRS